ncbi:MAG: GGDEF domain-containing protein [Dehalococcoidia bacterium]|nr:GGDEF domain-containing protein [Dehalococcoidia bacterium]
MGIIADISERKELENQLAHLATHDPLTGLPNRRSLEETLNRVTARARRGVASSLLFLDLDNFKEVNDVKGHAAGDKALVAVARQIQEQLRAEDLLVRLGGDEFAVVLEGATSDDFQATAERIRQAVKEFRFSIDEYILNLTLSIGAVVIDGQHTPQMHLSRADAAMYKAKDQGGDRIMLYE